MLFHTLKVKIKMLFVEAFSHKNRAKGIKQMPTDELISYIMEDSSDETRMAVKELTERYSTVFNQLVHALEEARIR